MPLLATISGNGRCELLGSALEEESEPDRSLVAV